MNNLPGEEIVEMINDTGKTEYQYEKNSLLRGTLVSKPSSQRLSRKVSSDKIKARG